MVGIWNIYGKGKTLKVKRLNDIASKGLTENGGPENAGPTQRYLHTLYS